MSIENVFAVELSACPSQDEIKKLPNKVLLWCGEYLKLVVSIRLKFALSVIADL